MSDAKEAGFLMTYFIDSNDRHGTDECISVNSLDEKLWAAWRQKNAVRDPEGLAWQYAVLNWLCLALLASLLFWALSHPIDLALRAMVGAGAIVGGTHSVRERRYVRALFFAFVATLLMFVAPGAASAGPLRVAIFATAATPFITALASRPRRLGFATRRWV
jgi:hypothetical protein